MTNAKRVEKVFPLFLEALGKHEAKDNHDVGGWILERSTPAKTTYYNIIEIVNVKRGAHRGMHLRYNNANIDTRMALMTKCPTLVAILKVCIAEYAAQKDERKRLRKLEEQE